MINFHFETEFELKDEANFSDWISRIIVSEGFTANEISYIFCDDAYLLKINQQYLGHDTYTDIITFDYSDGKTLNSDIYISIERVKENAKQYLVEFGNELLRVMSHGILHLCGYKDKSVSDANVMRAKEEEKIKLFHVEQ